MRRGFVYKYSYELLFKINRLSGFKFSIPKNHSKIKKELTDDIQSRMAQITEAKAHAVKSADKSCLGQSLILCKPQI